MYNVQKCKSIKLVIYLVWFAVEVCVVLHILVCLVIVGKNLLSHNSFGNRNVC